MAIAMLSRKSALVGTVRLLSQEVGKCGTGLAHAAIGIHEKRLAGMNLPNQDPQYQDRSPQAPHENIMDKKSNL
jgi:hypothetical protein